MEKNKMYYGISPLVFWLVPPIKYAIVDRKLRDVAIFAGSRFIIFTIVFFLLKIPLQVNFSDPHFLLLVSTFATFIFPIIAKSLLKSRDIVKQGNSAVGRLFLFLALLFLIDLAIVVFAELGFLLTNFLLFILDILISYMFSRFIYRQDFKYIN